MAENNTGKAKTGYGYGKKVQQKDSDFDIRELWGIFMMYKYWVIASVIVCLGCAFVYLRYSTNMYQITSKVLIKDKDNKNYSTAIGAQFQELGLANASNGFDNELEIIGTKTLNKRVVKELKLYTNYYVEGKVKDKEIYGKYSPYVVDFGSDVLDTLSVPVKVEMKPIAHGIDVKVTIDKEEYQKKLTSFPAHVSTSVGKLSIEKNPLLKDLEETKTITCFLMPVDYIAQAYANSLNVAATSKTTTVAELTLTDNIPERSADYLSTLVDVYNEDADVDNKIEAKRTADFIEERLSSISKELNMTEEELQTYKQSSGIVDYMQDASMDATQSVQYDAKLMESQTQLSLAQYLSEYVNDSRNHLQPIPSNVGVADAGLIATISKYNEAVIERNKLLRSAPENSPSVTIATNEAEAYLATIKTSLRSSIRELGIKTRDLSGQKQKYTSRISSAPAKERALAVINRQQEVKAGLYVMLLQKREENLITLASGAYKAKLIEEPLISGPISPKRKMIMLLALALGIGLPFAYHYIREFFRYRVQGKEDLAKLCNVPLFGTVPYVKALSQGNRHIVLEENKNSKMMEVYRNLRSNLPFVLKPEQKVILFTSSTAGEGKTSIASNLGTSIAFAGKKVLLMGLDIRKPRLAQLFDLSDSEIGMSNYLSREAKDFSFLEKCIQKSGISDNLDILPAGTIPPNPSELLERENLQIAINYLRDKYDYILLDTAPVGLVSDTFTISRSADVTMFVVRANYTLRTDIDFINSLAEDNRLPNLNIVLNGAEIESNGYSYKRYGYGKGGYGYGYGSAYGYGYGYGDKDGKQLEEV